jgi:hypothetical protein
MNWVLLSTNYRTVFATMTICYVVIHQKESFFVLLFLPTARSAVGLGITFHTFTPAIVTFGHLAIWPFDHFNILTF